MKLKHWLLPLVLALLLWQRLAPRPDRPASPEARVSVAPTVSEETSARWCPVPPRQEDAPEAAVPDASPDREQQVRLLTPEGIIELSLRDYLIGVVAAEMPASFEPEALRAQAVASRSCTMHRLRSGDTRHEGAELCSSSACCQAYRSDGELRERWGERYEAYRAKIEEAVDATAGLCLYYGEELIYAPFHSSSFGQTEDSAAVWSPTPYLVSVPSPESEDLVPQFVVRVSFSREELRQRLSPAYPSLKEAELRLGSVRRTAAGRVESVELGGLSIPGTKLRKLLSLRSTNFTVEEEGGGFTFTTRGYGHGVGMSQYGAEALALEGADFREILARYYPGTALGQYGP